MSITDERLNDLERRVARLEGIVTWVLPSQNEHIRQMADAIRAKNNKRIRELNKLASLRMGDAQGKEGAKKPERKTKIK